MFHQGAQVAFHGLNAFKIANKKLNRVRTFNIIIVIWFLKVVT